MSGGRGEERLKECFLKAVIPKLRPGQVEQEERACAKTLRQESLTYWRLKLSSVRREEGVRDESVKEGREAHEGHWGQAKELSSQWETHQGCGAEL